MIRYGFVKLPREVTERPWFGDSAALAVYVFLLCNSAFEDMEYAGRTLCKGQYITSHRQLAERIGIGIQQAKTALKNLTLTRDITVEATTKFSIITVNSLVGDDDPNTLVNTLANTLVNKQTNNRSRSIEEKNKEEIKKEKNREEAAPPFTTLFDNEISVEALTERYGSETVRRYEEKFRKWAEGKNTSKISMYPTIAKWLAEDIKLAVPGRGRACENSSLDIDEFERNLLEQYVSKQKGSEP